MKAYLLIYNLVSLAAWSYLLYECIDNLMVYYDSNLINRVTSYYVTHLYHDFPHKSLAYIQLINSSFEIFHILIGIVKAPLLTTILQSIARLGITVGVCMLVPSSPGNYDIVNFSGLSLAWSITEIIRYGFYVIKSITENPPYLTLWLRYTLFIILYPIGLVTEVRVVYKTIPYSPNKPLKYFFIWALFAYIPGFLVLYSYMFKQRKKILNKKQKIL